MRLEKVGLVAQNHDASIVTFGFVESANFLGDAILYRIDVGKGRHMLVKTTNTAKGSTFARGGRVGLAWSADDLVVVRSGENWPCSDVLQKKSLECSSA